MRKIAKLILVLLVTIQLILLSASGSKATFNKYLLNPILNPGLTGSWDNQAVIYGFVLNEGILKMWYYGANAPLTGNVGLATSSDSLSWTKYFSNPVLAKDTKDPTELEVASPSVIKINNLYKMWYLSTTNFTGSGNEVYRIKYATSTDGINWSLQGYVLRKRSSVAWESEGVANPSVIFSSGEYKMWYDARDSSGIWRIGYATSTDGIVWTRVLNPVLTASLAWEGTTVAAPSVFLQDNTYHLYYHAGPVVPKYIGHATSTDGINWTKDPNPILATGGFADFDRTYVASPEVVRAANKLKLYYSGFDGANWRIGLAEELLPVPYFSQKDPVWGTDTYDSANNWAGSNSRTMSAVGCALTSAAMVLRHFNVQKTPGNPTASPGPLPPKDLTPGTLNEWLKSRNDGAFRNGSVNWAVLGKLTKLAHDLDPTSPKLEYFSSPSAKLADVIGKQLPAILNIKYPPSPSNTHFVVAISANGGTYNINDPYYASRTTLAPDYSDINRVGYYQLTNSDFSYLIFAVNPEVTLSLKNSLGQPVGEEYIEDPLYDLDNQTPSGATPLKILYVKQPLTDTYALEITSPTGQPYQLDSYLYDHDGDGGIKSNTGTLGGGDHDLYQITFNSQAAANSDIQPQNPFKTLKDDIEAAYTSGGISNQGVYRSILLAEQVAEKAAQKGKTALAKLTLKALLDLLTYLHHAYLTDDTYNILTHDVGVALASL